MTSTEMTDTQKIAAAEMDAAYRYCWRETNEDGALAGDGWHPAASKDNAYDQVLPFGCMVRRTDDVGVHQYDYGGGWAETPAAAVALWCDQWNADWTAFAG